MQAYARDNEVPELRHEEMEPLHDAVGSENGGRDDVLFPDSGKQNHEDAQMTLTSAQLTTLAADIAADGALAAQPLNSDGAFAIAAAYNATASPDYYVWNPRVDVQDIEDAVVWANFTPQDAPDGTATWTNRALACQGKQFNLQLMIAGKTTLDATKPGKRTGLQDALTSIPSGASGANKTGGWNAVQLVLSRKATRGEKLFATGTGSQASPATMAVVGQITLADVQAARGG